jgi:hypothetical protein
MALTKHGDKRADSWRIDYLTFAHGFSKDIGAEDGL